MITNIAQQGIFFEERMNLVQDRQIRYMEVAISNGQNSKWAAGMYKTAQNYPEAHPPSTHPPFTTQPRPPQMPKTSKCLRSSLWQVNFAYVDKWGGKSDWQTCFCLCMFVNILCVSNVLKSNFPVLAATEPVGSFWCRLELKKNWNIGRRIGNTGWNGNTGHFWFLVSGILVLTGLHVSLRKKSI